MAEPRWLNDEEQRAWRAFLLATRVLWGHLERDVQRETGMPLAYYEILSSLSEQPEWTMRMSELADRLQVSPSRLSHAVARLEESGWVQRRPASSDRRGWMAVLTEAGYGVVVAAAPVHVDSVRARLFDALEPEQVEQMRQISETLLTRLCSRAVEGNGEG